MARGLSQAWTIQSRFPFSHVRASQVFGGLSKQQAEFSLAKANRHLSTKGKQGCSQLSVNAAGLQEPELTRQSTAFVSAGTVNYVDEQTGQGLTTTCTEAEAVVILCI